MQTAIQSGADLIDSAYMFKPGIVEAAKAFARSKPWRGDIDERKAKFEAAVESLAKAAEIDVPTLEFDDDIWQGGPSDRSCASRRTIYLVGRLSVVTLLNLFAGIAGHDGIERYRWSLNLFARCFPISFGRCYFEGLILRR